MLSRVLLLRPSSVAVTNPVNLKILRRLCSNSAELMPEKKIVFNTPHIITEGENVLSEGQEYEGFECIRTEKVPEFNLTSYTLKHKQTATELWYLERNDPNNVFSINFRTTPFDSTGLPHILEHSVLCGSQLYPIRDPFFKMLNRSVATFMNAMTGPDYTMYPFSSMNETDFRNLQKIYLDAVFRPNLEYLDFLQEGWRLEHSNLKDKNSEYVLKGVVYNEMKGAFSENSSVFGQNLLNNLLPDHTYGFVSGGNPLEIPKLTHQNLIDFHKKYYHPSNSRIFIYGSFDIKKSLNYLNANYLSKYTRIDPSYSRIPNQPRWLQPRNVHISSRFDKMGAPFDKQNQTAIAILLSDVTLIQETFTLYILSELLIRGPNSPFYKAFIEPNFSGGYNQTTGFDPQIKDTYFCVGLQDIHVDDFNRFFEGFDKTLEKVVQEGFEEKHIESVLHNIELSLKHQSPQFGMGLLFNSTALWNHDGDVVQNLHVSRMISTFRKNLRNNPKFLQQKVEQYFVKNTHRLKLSMTPDDNYEDNFKTAELDLLKQKILSLDISKREDIYENGLKLEQSQKAIPNLDILPCLSLSDVQQTVQNETVNIMNFENVSTQLCHIHTNDITYLKCYFEASSSLNRDDIMLIPLFCNVINDMGTANYDFREFDKIVLSKTAGINFKLHFSENIYHANTYNLGVLMTTHALDKNADDMFKLCEELLKNFKMDDVERLRMLIDNYISNISVGIASSGHLYAMQSCAGLVTDSAQLKSLLSGLEHIEFMKSYIKANDTATIMQNLSDLGHKLFIKDEMRVSVNTSEQFYPTFLKSYTKFLKNLPSKSVNKIEKAVSMLPPSCQHFEMNIPVNYCAKTFFSVPYAHKDHPTLRVLAKLISAKYLLPVVREQNGAYGSGAKISADGIFSFFSYRDPNSTQTLEVFDNTYNWLQDHSAELLNEQTLFEAKLGVLQQLDAPIAPGNVGIDNFLYGVSQEMFLTYRSNMLAVTLPELKTAIDKYFKNEPKHSGKCILGPADPTLEQKTNRKWKITS